MRHKIQVLDIIYSTIYNISVKQEVIKVIGLLFYAYIFVLRFYTVQVKKAKTKAPLLGSLLAGIKRLVWKGRIQMTLAEASRYFPVSMEELLLYEKNGMLKGRENERGEIAGAGSAGLFYP